jgi:hypothetical protein
VPNVWVWSGNVDTDVVEDVPPVPLPDVVLILNILSLAISVTIFVHPEGAAAIKKNICVPDGIGFVLVNVPSENCIPAFVKVTGIF